MADQKISQLNSLLGANTASGDLVTIVDISDTTMGASGTNKKMTLAEFQASPVSAGTANGVLYLNGSKVPTSGSALTFDGTNLGIGTASPNARLVVQQANNTADGIRLFASGSDTQLITRYLASIDAWQVTASFSSTGAYKPITWWTSDLERMRLDASGNLGLGVTPSAWESTCRMLQLGAVGTVGRANSGQTQLGFNYFINSSGQYVYIQSLHATRHEQISGEHRWFNAASGTAGNVIAFTQAMTLDPSGNLGIGTASPAATFGDRVLQITGTASANSELRFTHTTSGSGSGDGLTLLLSGDNAFLFNRENGYLAFATNNVETMRLDASGNVGIGTASPGAKLEVYGGASGTVTNIQAGNASTGFQFGIDASNNCQVRTAQNVPMLFYTNATQRMQISADGNVLIGTAALATTATAGFPWIPSCAGVPTGAPAAPYTNAAAMVVDTTNNRLYVRVGSTWRYATLT